MKCRTGPCQTWTVPNLDHAKLDRAKLGLCKVKPRPALPNHHVRYPFFWDNAQHRPVICYWRFGTTYQPHLQIQKREQSTTEVKWHNFEGGGGAGGCELLWELPTPSGSKSLRPVHSPIISAALQRIYSCSSGQCSVCSHPLTTTHATLLLLWKGSLSAALFLFVWPGPFLLSNCYKWPHTSSPCVHNLVLCSPQLRSGHTESELPRRTVICARGRKDFELYCVRLHHPRQTEGKLTRRTSLVRSRQRRVVYCLQICRVVSREWRKNSLIKVREYVFLYDTGHPEYKNLGEIYPKSW
jgi:hypothetical protein